MGKSEKEKRDEMDRHNEAMRRRMQGLDPKTGRQPERPHGPRPPCFPQGALVSTPSGLRDIALLQEGESVLSFEAGSPLPRARRILRKITHGPHRLWELRFDDGALLRTTASHSFEAGGKWIKARDIVPGASITSLEGGRRSSKVVLRSQAAEAVEPVFNLIVEGDFTFVVDGVLAHSFTVLRRLRVFLWRVVGAMTEGSGRQRSWNQAPQVGSRLRA